MCFRYKNEVLCGKIVLLDKQAEYFFSELIVGIIGGVLGAFILVGMIAAAVCAK